MFVATDGISVFGFERPLPREIHALSVAPEYAKQGIDLLLLAQGFCKKAGFVGVGRSPVRGNDGLLSGSSRVFSVLGSINA